jgi:hypothetical protein
MKIEELKKGCGKDRTWKLDRSSGNTRWHYCGDDWLCSSCENQLSQAQEDKQKILEIIEEMENPYPKDIFLWTNKDKCDLHEETINQDKIRIAELEDNKPDLIAKGWWENKWKIWKGGNVGR